MPRLQRVLVKRVRGIGKARMVVKNLERQGFGSASFSDVTVSGRKLKRGNLEVYALARKRRLSGFQVRKARFI